MTCTDASFAPYCAPCLSGDEACDRHADPAPTTGPPADYFDFPPGCRCHIRDDADYGEHYSAPREGCPVHTPWAFPGYSLDQEVRNPPPDRPGDLLAAIRECADDWRKRYRLSAEPPVVLVTPEAEANRPEEVAQLRAAGLDVQVICGPGRPCGVCSPTEEDGRQPFGNLDAPIPGVS